jgi:lysylphosphatidylglycerol synthetase-like protein (DUF2156 family)
VNTQERLTLPIPYGQHVYVVSDLSLSPTSDPRSRPIQEFVALLNEIDDVATVVVAGNFFRPDPTSDLTRFLEATLRVLPELRSAIEHFTMKEGRRFLVLPGTDDAELAEHAVSQLALGALGITVASSLILQLATASGVRELAVAAGTCSIDVSRADPADRSDADRLEDPQALHRFVASRVLYRRLAGWVWFPLVAMVCFDLFNVAASVLNHFTHEQLRLHTPHTQSFWINLVVNLLVVAGLEALVAGVAGLLVRRRFARHARESSAFAHREPLVLTMVDGVDALEFARRNAELGGAGAVVGGSPRPALAFLDRGVCAAPGPSRTVVVERRGRLGLPPVFTTVDRLGVIEIEAAGSVQVRLTAGESPGQRATLLERLVRGAPLQLAPALATSTIGSWPTGDPFPLALDRLATQRAQRFVRRLASGLLFIDGVVNIAVTASPPLRNHLHTVLSILPLGVAQTAAAVTALAGIGLVMMARGVRRGQRRAWFVAVTALAVTIVAHLARGGGVRQSLLAIVILAFLVVQRANFSGSTDRTSVRVALPRLALVALVAVVAATVGIEAANVHGHLPNVGVVIVACAERLVGLGLITLPDRVGDFANPTLLSIGLALIIVTLYLLTRPVVDRRLSQTGSSAERRVAEFRAREIVRRHGRGTLDYFALRDDKQFFFYRDSLVAYAVFGGVALVSPDPIGPTAERAEVFSTFRAYVESRGWTLGIMAAGEEWIATYHAAGLHALYVGDEALINCQTFSLEGGKMKGLRQAQTRLARYGYTVEFLDPATIEPRRVADLVALTSMLRRGDGERGFSMVLGRLFNPKDKGLLLTIVHGPDGLPAAICQFVPSPAINAYSLDLMRRDPGEHPNGLIDFALCSTIDYLRTQHVRELSLNFAAFRSVLESDEDDSTLTRVERWALKRLSGVLPIESLWTFNAKYHPTWLPRYLVYPAVESFVPVVAAILRAESFTEIPVLGRFLTNDPANRPGTVVPEDLLTVAPQSNETTI